MNNVTSFRTFVATIFKTARATFCMFTILDTKQNKVEKIGEVSHNTLEKSFLNLQLIKVSIRP